ANYTLADPASVTGVITAKEVTVADATLTKSYDGGTDFGSSSIKPGTGAVTGVVQGEALTLTASAGDYASADVGAGLTVSGATLGLSGTTPTKSTNYMLPSPVTLNGEITPKEVTVAAVTVTKPYDNTDSTSGAVIGGGAVSAAIGTQSFQLQLASDNDGVYVSTDAGDDINITGADFELIGADAASKPENYMLPALDLTGVIAPKVVSVGDVVVEKPYDGETGAAVAVATVDGGAVTGTIAPQTFDLALASGHNITYASSAASGTVVLNDQDSADFRLVSTGDGGGVPANYALPAITASGRIVPRVVDVAKVTLTKEYDRTNLADPATVSGGAITNTVQGDSLTLKSGGGVYASVDVSNNLVVMRVNFSLEAGGDAVAANYALPAQLDVVGVITPREVSVSGGTPSLFKDYDSLTVLGNTRVVEGITLGKLLGDDSLVLAVTAGVYADKKVDTGITVTGLEWELRKSKADAQGDPANYKLPLSITSLASINTAEIRPKPITITAGDGSAGKPSKIYDGTDTVPTGLGDAQAAAGQVFQGDDVGFIAASVYNSKNVLEATGITITLSGSDANNYVVIGGGIAAEITPKEVAVSGITLNGAASKVYDATTAAPSGFSISGSLTAADVIEADRGKVTFGGAGVYNSKNVSDAVTITIVFAGEEAGNYIASQPTTLATITKRPLIVTANTVSGLAADQPDAADLVYTVEKGVSGEGLAGSDRTTDVLSGALAYGTANTDGSVPIEIGSLVVVGGNYEIDFTTGVFIPSSMLDVDASQTVDGTDGIIISRYLLGLRGDALTAGLPRVSGAQGSSGMIATRVEKLREEGTLDVDGNSVTNAADGILIARYLLGVVSGSGLTDGQTSAGSEEGVKTKIKGLLPPAAE
ncbi:MAG: YDG domain-containing protein, partial [Gammaproteobacteria bacterium]